MSTYRTTRATATMASRVAATGEYPLIPGPLPDQPSRDWLPQRHRPLAYTGWALLAVAVLAGTVHALTASSPSLLAAAAAAGTLAGVAFIGALAIAALRTMLQQAADRIIARHRQETRQAAIGTGGLLAQCRAVMEQRILPRLAELDQQGRELERRVDEVEARDPVAGSPELLRCVANWAAHIDRRIAEVQASLPKPASGDTDQSTVSPMELSDEALRGYFMGFYDRGDNPAP